MKRGGPLKRRTTLKRTGRLRQQSSKTRSIERAAADVRRRWINEAGRCCMICGHSHLNPNPKYPPQLSKVVCHEIANGHGYRLAALDKPFAVLCVCRACNEIELVDKSKWPEPRQLCVLQAKAPDRYDLPKYLEFTNPRAPNRILQSEVDAYLPTLT
jgi:hypothetical protein